MINKNKLNLQGEKVTVIFTICRKAIFCAALCTTTVYLLNYTEISKLIVGKTISNLVDVSKKCISYLLVILSTPKKLIHKGYRRGLNYQFLTTPPEIQNTLNSSINTHQNYILSKGENKTLDQSVEISQNTETIHDIGYQDIAATKENKTNREMLDAETSIELSKKLASDMASENPKLSDNQNIEFTSKKIHEWKSSDEDHDENCSFVLKNNVAYFKMSIFNNQLNIPGKGAIIIDLSKDTYQNPEKTEKKATRFSELEFKKEGYAVLPGKSYNFITRLFEVNK